MDGKMEGQAARVVLVTGGARGLGEVIARTFHRAGYRVAIGDIAIDEASRVAADLSADGSSAMALALDVTQKTAFEDARDTMLARWGRIDALVNNASTTKVVPVMDITPDQFDLVMNVNLRSVFFGCQVFGAHFATGKTGRIVNIASLAGQNGGSATGAHYAAAKGGVLTLTKVFARDLAASGVTVNAISPGPLDLPIVHQSVPAERLQQVIANIPAGRLGGPAYIADVAVMLAAENAFFATGACWDINGGLFMR